MTEPKGVASGIPVYCAFDEIIDIGLLRPHPKNPHRHTEEQIRLLAKMISVQGWRVPITVSKRSGYIIRGHCRLQAAQALGVKQVPVDRQEYKTEEDELADLIGDNRIQELSFTDNDGLKAILDELSKTTIDMEVTGFNEKEIVEMLSRPFDPFLADDELGTELEDADIEGDHVQKAPTLVFRFTDEDELAEVKGILGIKPHQASCDGSVLLDFLRGVKEDGLLREPEMDG